MAVLPYLAVKKITKLQPCRCPQICLNRPSSFKPTSKAFNRGLPHHDQYKPAGFYNQFTWMENMEWAEENCERIELWCYAGATFSQRVRSRGGFLVKVWLFSTPHWHTATTSATTWRRSQFTPPIVLLLVNTKIPLRSGIWSLDTILFVQQAGQIFRFLSDVMIKKF